MHGIDIYSRPLLAHVLAMNQSVDECDRYTQLVGSKKFLIDEQRMEHPQHLTDIQVGCLSRTVCVFRADLLRRPD